MKAFFYFFGLICQNRYLFCTFAANYNAMNNNLKPYRTEEEAREGGRRGGIASGEARRRKKSMREWAEVLGECGMSLKMPDGSKVEADINAAVVLRQMEKAINGKDTNAANFLMRLRGEDVQKHEIVDDETKRALVKEQMEKLYGIDGDED